MPTPCNITFKGIEGSSEKEGREGTCDVYEIEHLMHRPASDGGSTQGSVIHSPLRLVKMIDKASPMLNRALSHGQIIGEVTLDFYRIDPDSRQEAKYYTIKLKNVAISDMRPFVPMTLLPQNERLQHMEQLSLVYDRIEWTWLPDNIVTEYDWHEERRAWGKTRYDASE